MKKIIIPILIITAVFTSCHKRVTETERTTAVGYAKKANLYRGQGKVDSAEFFFRKALKLDKDNIKYRFALIGIYCEKENFDKAFELLDGMPEKEKNTISYYQLKATILDLQGKYDLAKTEYIKVLELTEPVKVRSEADINPLLNYAVTETLAGKKDEALKKLNKALKMEGLSSDYIELIEVTRDKIVSYSGKGIKDFD